MSDPRPVTTDTSTRATTAGAVEGAQDAAVVAWPPMPIDGKAFVVIHSQDSPSQSYGQSYSFTTDASGEPKKLASALQAFHSGGPPVYLVIYRPGPSYAFTAWARVHEVYEEPGEGNATRWTIRLEHHEFPAHLELKGNAQALVKQIPWLAEGLKNAFNWYTIREIEPAHFLPIIATAQQLAREQPDPDLAPTPWRPTIYAAPDAHFWRIHFPRSFWPDAFQQRTIGVDFDEGSTDQSLKRFHRIKAGDRIVAYVQGGTIGSIGVVTEPFRADQPPTGAAASLFGGAYRQRLGVAWADSPDAPVRLLDELKQPDHTTLYNRLKNPQTVAPLTREDYAELLTLLGVDDVGTPATETRLPAAWQRLGVYCAFAQQLAPTLLSAADVLAAAQRHDASLNPLVDVDGLIEDLRRLRLLRTLGDDQYLPWEHTQGDRTALRRLAVLALLVPVEGSADTYTLPARTILPRLRAATTPQPSNTFAPELGDDQYRLLAWYRDAGLVQYDEAQGTWLGSDGALEPRPGTDPATLALNVFLRTLIAELEQNLKTDLDPAQGPLPPSRDLDAALRALSRDLLIDPQLVRRIYRSLMAGRHVILSGPPGTGKTELARRLPRLIWEEAEQEFTRLTSHLDQPPALVTHEQRHGYAALVVTATEDWGVRDVVGGIAPQLDADKKLSYTIQYGALTRAILQHYEGTDAGRRLPLQAQMPRRVDYRDEQARYRGVWLVIDEFTRAPVDAAFGGLLTTLSGGEHAVLSVPVADGTTRDLPLPPDFRIIGTLNSFDRHFLNQMSEAIKRRFDFIDIPPPSPLLAPQERGIVAAQALKRLAAQQFHAIEVAGDPPAYRWDQLQVRPVAHNGGLAYEVEAPAGSAIHQALDGLWRLFDAIRVFRQLGTAQLVALHTNMFAGVLVGMAWDEALDTALADALADQLQVLTGDEQQIIEAYLDHVENAEQCATAINAYLADLQAPRRAALRVALQEGERQRSTTRRATITRDETPLSGEQIAQVFACGAPLPLGAESVFRRRLRDLIGERGL